MDKIKSPFTYQIDDDLEVDDVLHAKKTKKINCGKKGKRVERELAKIMNERFGGDFSRSIGSGNRWGQGVKLPDHAKDVYTGDLVCPVGFAFVLESKGGYDDVDFSNIFIDGNTTIDSFFKQVDNEAEDSKRKPMLLWKRSRRPWLAAVKTLHLPHLNWDYRLIYKEWSVVALSELLKLEDSWFYLELV